MKIFKKIAFLAFSIALTSVLPSFNQKTSAEIYKLRKPEFTWQPDGSFWGCGYNSTDDDCEITSSIEADGSTTVNLKIKIKKAVNTNTKPSLLNENLNNNLIAAIEYCPSEGFNESLHRSALQSVDSTEPEFEKILTASFKLKQEEISKLKQLNSPESIKNNNNLAISIYKDNVVNAFENKTNASKFLGHFEIKESDSTFKSGS